MSIILSAADLCKYVLKINNDVFKVKKRKGHFKKESIQTNVDKVWENLDKLFPSSGQVVRENVSEKKMYDSVRTLLLGKQTDSVVLYEFAVERETRQGEKNILR